MNRQTCLWEGDMTLHLPTPLQKWTVDLLQIVTSLKVHSNHSFFGNKSVLLQTLINQAKKQHDYCTKCPLKPRREFIQQRWWDCQAFDTLLQPHCNLFPKALLYFSSDVKTGCIFLPQRRQSGLNAVLLVSCHKQKWRLASELRTQHSHSDF